MSLDDQLRQELDAVAASVRVPAVPPMPKRRRSGAALGLAVAGFATAAVVGCLAALGLPGERHDVTPAGGGDRVESCSVAGGVPLVADGEPWTEKVRPWAEDYFGDRYAGIYIDRALPEGRFVIAVKGLAGADCRKAAEAAGRPGGFLLSSARYSYTELQSFRDTVEAVGEAFEIWIDVRANRVTFALAGGRERLRQLVGDEVPDDAYQVVERHDARMSSGD